MKRKSEEPRGRVCAVIPAAGSSSRMGGENKLLLPLLDVPVLVRTLAAFEQCDCIDEIIVTCREQDIVPYSKLARTYGFTKVTSIVRGGATRADSVLAGVRACPEDTELVAIHDGARPLVTVEIIREAVSTAAQYGAAAPVVALKDSIKRVEDGHILADVPRDTVAAVQTPQVFRLSLIEEALASALASGRALTDDCAAAEALGVDVRATAGSYENIKITTQEDIAIGEAILAERTKK
ncbi:MAG: 2-C-methyl-D-erythritol 4-phosphate cytidylyltransferase [Intestinibacillus sp.]